jgi:hypothetical protein
MKTIVCVYDKLKMPGGLPFKLTYDAKTEMCSLLAKPGILFDKGENRPIINTLDKIVKAIVELQTIIQAGQETEKPDYMLCPMTWKDGKKTEAVYLSIVIDKNREAAHVIFETPTAEAATEELKRVINYLKLKKSLITTHDELSGGCFVRKGLIAF